MPIVPSVHMSLSHQDMKRLAELARLELSEEELLHLEKDMQSILGYVDRLQAVDTRGVEPLSLEPRSQGWREDVASLADEATRGSIVGNFPSRIGDALSVPAVFDKPKK